MFQKTSDTLEIDVAHGPPQKLTYLISHLKVKDDLRKLDNFGWVLLAFPSDLIEVQIQMGKANWVEKNGWNLFCTLL